MDSWLPKGGRIRARWLQAKPLGTFSLAGAQMKVAAETVEVVGTVRHLRGDQPVNPTVVHLYVDPEGPVPDWLPRCRPEGCTCTTHGELLEVAPHHVVEVLHPTGADSGPTP